MKQIPLSRGLFATVDDADFDWLNQWKWSALKTGRPGAKPKFYAVRTEACKEAGGRRRTILMHRVLSGAGLGQVTDHRDLNTLNNSRGNLRATTQSLNSLNHSGHRDRASRYKGVYKHKQNPSWVAEFRGRNAGSYPTEEEAARAYDRAALAYSSDYSRLNFAVGG